MTLAKMHILTNHNTVKTDKDGEWLLTTLIHGQSRNLPTHVADEMSEVISCALQ